MNFFVFFVIAEIVPEQNVHAKIILKMMMTCRSVDQSSRPTASNLKEWIKMRGFAVQNIVELILQRLQVQATTLEEEVILRTEQLVEEKKKVDELLHEMLPR
jgi:hypothetical protein